MKYTNIFKSLFLLAGLVVATNVWGGNFSKTYAYAALKTMISGQYSDENDYFKVPSAVTKTAIVTIPSSDFANQPNGDITLTFKIATYGSGNNPTKNNTTLSALGAESGSNWAGSTIEGTMPSSSSYKDVTVKVTKATSPTTLGGLKISISVNTGVKILRLKQITMEYSYDDETPCSSTKVAITKGASPNGSFTLSTDEVCPDGAGGTVFVTGITPADGYQFKEIRTSASGDVDNTNKKVSGIKAATTITVVFSKITGTSDIEVVEVTKDNGIVIEYDINASASITISQHEEKHEGKTAEEIFFSKYFEAASSVKLLAVFNGTDHEIDISEYSLADASHFAATKFKNFSYDGTAPASLKLKRGQEMIFITYKTDVNADKEIVKCAKNNPKSGFEKYYKVSTPALTFNGDDAMMLYNANNELIDIIGAANGSGKIAPASGTQGNVRGFMDNPGGWYTEQGTKIEVNGQPEQAGYALSTNRCLLIRKKDVVSGAIAVAKNTDTFYTLGDTVVGGETIKGEWKGFQIPGPSSGAGSTNSCTGFEAVGSYDYSKYYDTWIPVPAEVIGGGQNPDGTVTIKVNDLEQRACKTLKIELKDNGGNVVSEKEYDVPIIIKTDHSTKDPIFNQMKDTCKTCDVVILADATLTKENDANKHWGDSARKVDIYAGGKLVVPAGKTYYAEDIIVRTHGTKESWLLDAPEIVLNNGSKIMIPNSTISPAIGQRVRIETGSDADLTYYMVSFPYHVVLADVTYSDESPATFNTDFFIYKYDGERRANSQTASGNWVPFTGTMLEPGIGYLVAAKERSGHTYRELLFPMVDPGLNQNDAEPVTKPVGVNAWGWKDDIRPNHKGWNFVSNPYLRGYQNSQLATDAGGKMSIGFLEQHEDGYWYISETEPKVEYITVLDADGKDYHQEKVSLTNLPAFQPFFVQIGTGDMDSGADAQIEFKAANRVAAAPGRRMTTDRPSVSSLGLLIEGAEAVDNCGIVIGEQYGPAYELMADLSKEFGSAYSLKAYTLQDGDNMRLAFHAIHPDRLTNTIPVGVRMPATAEYTFRIDKRYDLSDFEHVWLHDAETGEYTDLLYNDYTFNGTKQQNDSRFKLTVSLRPKTPTDVDHVLSGIFVNGRDGALMISGLPEEASVYVYDLNGRLLVSDHTQRLNTAIYPLSTGVYQVRVEGNGQNALLKAIVK